MAPHSSTLAWEIPWMEESGRLQSMGSLRVGHDWATSLSRIGEGNGNPLQCSCLENPRDGGAWRAAISGVAQSRTRLTRLSSSSSTCKGFPGSSVGKESTCNAVNPGSIPGWGRFPGGDMATHSSILAWKIPRTEEPGRLPSMGLPRVEHDLVTKPSPVHTK